MILLTFPGTPLFFFLFSFGRQRMDLRNSKAANELEEDLNLYRALTVDLLRCMNDDPVNEAVDDRSSQIMCCPAA